MITIAAESLEFTKRLVFSIWREDAYTCLGSTPISPNQVNGVVTIGEAGASLPDRAEGDEVVRIELVENRSDAPTRHPGRQTCSLRGRDYVVFGYVWSGESWQEHAVEVIPVRQDLFSRTRGLLETGVLATLTVLIKGLGSVGSTVTRLLVQSGVCRFILLDDDRLKVVNLIRHEAGLMHIGRPKTDVMADLIREKNPYAEVQTHELRLDGENLEFVRGLVRQATLCIDTADEREGRLLLNRLCLQENKTLIIGGAFGRAYGGQVFRVKPGQTACYQCLVKMLREDRTGFPRPEPERVSYEDPFSPRPAIIEPGLSIDIEPISQMTAKLALQELLQGVPTTLRSLDQDLEANWYLWLNRREAGTPYESLQPLGFGMETMAILRWYGIKFERDPACPACGDFASVFAARHGLTASGHEFAEFLRQHQPKEDCHG